MNSLDWIFVALIALLGIRCMARGFVKEILSMAGIIVGVLAALFFYRSAGELLVSWGLPAKPEGLPEILGFLVAFLAAFLLMKLVGRLISEGVEAAVLGGVDKARGLVLGLAEGMLLVCLFLIAMSLLEPAFKSIPGYAKLLRDSAFAQVILPIVGPEVVKATQGITAPELKLRLDTPPAKKP
jgi:membrane protein required for colicin V production